jgi:hypothetical protein
LCVERDVAGGPQRLRLGPRFDVIARRDGERLDVHGRGLGPGIVVGVDPVQRFVDC